MLAQAETRITRVRTTFGEQMRMIEPDEMSGGREPVVLKADFHMHTHFSPDSEDGP